MAEAGRENAVHTYYLIPFTLPANSGIGYGLAHGMCAGSV